VKLWTLFPFGTARYADAATVTGASLRFAGESLFSEASIGDCGRAAGVQHLINL
jgi:hypothetical protein